MPDKRTHRGPHPADAELFAPEMLPRLRQAVADFSMLLTKGYADKSALKLVGDRFSLTQRQRLAVMRSACSDRQRQSRLEREVPVEALAGRSIAIDGYNLLITIEAALSGGLLFKGRDGCLRDLASIHGTYRKVEETIPAIEQIGDFLANLPDPTIEAEPHLHHGRNARDVEGPCRPAGKPCGTGIAHALWLLDSPVSNSGRLKTLIAQLASDRGWPWEIRLTISPDAELRQMDTIPATTDSAILDACSHWANLAMAIVQHRLPTARILDLAPSSGSR